MEYLESLDVRVNHEHSFKQNTNVNRHLVLSDAIKIITFHFASVMASVLSIL